MIMQSNKTFSSRIDTRLSFRKSLLDFTADEKLYFEEFMKDYKAALEEKESVIKSFLGSCEKSSMLKYYFCAPEIFDDYAEMSNPDWEEYLEAKHVYAEPIAPLPVSYLANYKNKFIAPGLLNHYLGTYCVEQSYLKELPLNERMAYLDL